LALDKDERISSVLALPEDESTWGELELMFATKKGTVRRNSLTDFQRISRGGKIAMKLQEDEDQIINVAICSPSDDVLLTTKMGQCIRFSATDVRVFKGRDSTGVRGINLANGDEVISMSILKGVEADSSERNAYIKRSRAERGEEASDEVETIETDETANVIGALSDERYAQLKASEQFILAVTDDGFGKRSSSFEYRLTGRGGKGIVAHKLVRKGTSLVAAFAVEDSDDLMMVTDGGQLIRTQVSQIGIKGRATQGVKLIRVGDDEKVVSVERLSETGDDEAAEVVQETNQNSDV